MALNQPKSMAILNFCFGHEKILIAKKNYLPTGKGEKTLTKNSPPNWFKSEKNGASLMQKQKNEQILV